MTEYTSEIKTLPYNQQVAYTILSDMDNLEILKDQIPSDKIQDLSFDKDSCSFSVSPIGLLKISIVEREPQKTIKFAVDQAPIDANLWIHLLPVNEEETKMELIIRANLNPFLKSMLSKQLQDGVHKIANILAGLPYDEIMAQSQMKVKP